MHTLVAYFKTEAGAATLDTITNVLDQTVPQDGAGNFLFQKNWKVLAAHALGATLSRARLFSPFLTGIYLPEIYPFVVGATVPDNLKVQDLRAGGPPVLTNDPIGIQASVTGAGDVLSALWVGDDARPISPGPILRARWTAAVTLTAGTWVNTGITFASTLPAGTYRCVGMQVICTACYLARLVLTGDNRYRPGVVAQPTLGFSISNGQFSAGNFGDFGTFTNTNPPTVDFLGVAAGAQTPVGWFDLVRQ